MGHNGSTGRVLTAHVVDAASRHPIEGARVEVDADSDRDWPDIVASAATDALGVARIPNLPPGRLLAAAKASGWVDEGTWSYLVGSDEERGSFNIVLPLERGASLAGRVHIPDWAPGDFWYLTAWRESRVSKFTRSYVLGPDGAFRFEDLPNEGMRLIVHRTRAGKTQDLVERVVRPPADHVELALPPAKARGGSKGEPFGR